MIRVLADSELEMFPALEWTTVAESMSSEARNALDQVMASQDGSVLSREQCLLLAHAHRDPTIRCRSGRSTSPGILRASARGPHRHWLEKFHRTTCPR